MEGWFNRSFQYFSLQKNRNEFEKAQQWDGNKNYVINQDGYVIYVIYTFDRKLCITLQDLLEFINIGFIRISGWQCVKLLKDLIVKYTEMKKQNIIHGNLSLQTIWLVFDKQKMCLNYDFKGLSYKIQFTGYSLNPQKPDEEQLKIVLRTILQILPTLQTENDKKNFFDKEKFCLTSNYTLNKGIKQQTFIEVVQTELLSKLNGGIDICHKVAEAYLKCQSTKANLQHFKFMDDKFVELDKTKITIRAGIIQSITKISSQESNDFISNLTIDSQVRNTVISMLSQSSLYKGTEKAKSTDELKYESEQWRQFLLCPLGNQNQIKGLIDNYENQMKTELGKAFKFEIKVPIADIKQWIQEQFYRIQLLTLIEAQCLNSYSQFNNFIQSGVNIDYATINKKILTEYYQVHQQEFGKMIEDLIKTLQ